VNVASPQPEGISPEMKDKIYPTLDAAVADVPSGASIFFGGFGGAGFPNNLIRALERQGAAGLTAISNNCGSGEGELSVLFKAKRIRRVVSRPAIHILSSAICRRPGGARAGAAGDSL